MHALQGYACHAHSAGGGSLLAVEKILEGERGQVPAIGKLE